MKAEITADMSTAYSEASVHGRFQPPHNGHLEYILAAKARSRFLWIGITQPDVRRLLPSQASPHRSEPLANPLTYFERLEIITEMLLAEGIPREEFMFVPFPIEDPPALPSFLSMRIPCLTTVYDNWNRQKVQILKSLGYTVEVLYERSQKIFAGTAVRASIAAGTEEWESLVPPSVAQALRRLDVRSRLLSAGHPAPV